MPIVEDGTLRDDSFGETLQLNALAFSLQKDINGVTYTDPFNGLEDLHNGIIRTPLDPDTTYSDDPLRMISAVRFASRFSFSIVDDSSESIKRNRDRISILSMESNCR